MGFLVELCFDVGPWPVIPANPLGAKKKVFFFNGAHPPIPKKIRKKTLFFFGGAHDSGGLSVTPGPGLLKFKFKFNFNFSH